MRFQAICHWKHFLSVAKVVYTQSNIFFPAGKRPSVQSWEKIKQANIIFFPHFFHLSIANCNRKQLNSELKKKKKPSAAQLQHVIE